MKYFFILITFSVLIINNINAQGLPPIQTDRPDQTECAYIVPARHFQIETGLIYEKLNAVEKTFVYPTVLWKYGVNEKFEVRLITELQTQKTQDNKLTGFSPVAVGFKTKLAEEKGIVPLTSFIAHLSIPGIASNNFKATYFAPSFRFTMQHTLSSKISLGYNLGAEWDGETGEPIFIYTLTSGTSLSEKVGAYIEVYGFAPQQKRPDHRADGGLTFFPKPNIMLDISGGFGISNNVPDYYGSIGFSIRLPK